MPIFNIARFFSHSLVLLNFALALVFSFVGLVMPANAQIDQLTRSALLDPVETSAVTAEIADVGDLGLSGTPPSGIDALRGSVQQFQSTGTGVSGEDMMTILEAAAEAGQPLALWRLGQMYETGVGVAQDQVRAFGYFSRIANDNADTPPRSIEADIVARSFIKVGDYYRVGLPAAGIVANLSRARAMLFHAASYFGDPDAQYRIGLLYLDDNEMDKNILQGARWLSLAAHKGHVSAQAVLGDLLFNGDGIPSQPVEGLMWLTLAHDATLGSTDEDWINELLTRAMSIASPEQRLEARNAANSVRGSLSVN